MATTTDLSQKQLESDASDTAATASRILTRNLDAVDPGDVITSELMNNIVAALPELETTLVNVRDKLAAATATSLDAVSPSQLRSGSTLRLYGNFHPVPSKNRVRLIPPKTVQRTTAAFTTQAVTISTLSTASHRSLLAFNMPSFDNVPTSGVTMTVEVKNADTGETVSTTFTLQPSETKVDKVTDRSGNPVFDTAGKFLAPADGILVFEGSNFARNPELNNVRFLSEVEGVKADEGRGAIDFQRSDEGKVWIELPRATDGTVKDPSSWILAVDSGGGEVEMYFTEFIDVIGA